MNENKTRTANAVKAKKVTRERKDPNALPDRTMAYIDYLVNTAPKSHIMNCHDAEDLRSECYLTAVKLRESFDPNRGNTLATFLEKGIWNAFSHFFRDRARLKRSCVQYTLDELVINEAGGDDGEDEECSRADMVPAPERNTEKEEREMALDIESFLATIADRRIREAVRLMLAGESTKNDIADAIGVSYGTYRYKIEPTAKAYLKQFLNG